MYRYDLYSRTLSDGISRGCSSGSISVIRLSINMNLQLSGVSVAAWALKNSTHVACLSAGVIFLSKSKLCPWMLTDLCFFLNTVKISCICFGSKLFSICLVLKANSPKVSLVSEIMSLISLLRKSGAEASAGNRRETGSKRLNCKDDLVVIFVSASKKTALTRRRFHAHARYPTQAIRQ